MQHALLHCVRGVCRRLQIFNWSIVGPIMLNALFAMPGASLDTTEALSSRKYSQFPDYQAAVARFYPTSHWQTLLMWCVHIWALFWHCFGTVLCSCCSVASLSLLAAGHLCPWGHLSALLAGTHVRLRGESLYRWRTVVE